MGTSTTEEISVTMPDPTKAADDKKPTRRQPTMIGNINLPSELQPVVDFYRKYTRCLHDACDSKKTSPKKDDRDERLTAERVAYKRLMEDMGSEPTDEHPFNVMMWVVHALVLLFFVVFLVTTWNVPRIEGHRCLHLRVHDWVALLMVLVSGLPVVRFATYAASEPLVWVRRKHKYTVYFARQLKWNVDVTIWLAIVLWVWFTFFRPQIVLDTRGAKTLDTSVEEYKHVVKVVVKQITRLLMSVTIGAIIWTVKSLLFYRLVADIHFGDLCKRIRYAILHLHVIQFVQHRGYWNFLTTSPKINKTTTAAATTTTITSVNTGGHSSAADRDDDKNAEEEVSFWMAVSRLRKETAPIWILKRLTYTYLRHMRRDKPTILQRLEATNDDHELLQVAKTLLGDVTERRGDDDDDQRDITRGDLVKYGLQETEIDHVFELLAIRLGRNTVRLEKITQDEFLRWVVLAVKNCLGLEGIIESSKRIFWKLDFLMNSCVVLLVLVIGLLLSEIVTTAQLAILFAPFISASFIFGKSLSEIFGGIIFVFCMHPFDLGDRVIIDGVEMKVRKLNILTTVFIKYDTGVEAIYPNSELSTKSIVKLDMIPDQSDFIEFILPIDTPEELILDLQVRIKKTLDDNLTYSSDTTIAKKRISDKDITIAVHFKYLVSYFSAETRALHRSKVLTLIVGLRKELDNAINYSKQNESYSPLAEVIVRFKIDTKVKLPKIDVLKNEIIRILGRHDQGLKECSQVLFTGIDKDKITMEVRMRYRVGLFDVDELNRIKSEVEKAIEEHRGQVCAEVANKIE